MISKMKHKKSMVAECFDSYSYQLRGKEAENCYAELHLANDSNKQ